MGNKKNGKGVGKGTKGGDEAVKILQDWGPCSVMCGGGTRTL